MYRSNVHLPFYSTTITCKIWQRNFVLSSNCVYISLYLQTIYFKTLYLCNIALKSGPLVGMSCMRYELKNSFFKRCAHIVCNFNNICHTLAYRHQQQALYAQLSNTHMRYVTTEFVQTLQCCDVLCSKFHAETTAEIAV